MTEAEWLASEDPHEMLSFLDGRATARKLRLFSVACCRRIRRLLVDERSRTAVEVAERFADGLATTAELEVAASAAWDAHLDAEDAEYHAAMAAYYSASDPVSPEAADVADAVVAATVCDPDDPEEEEVAQAGLLRDIFGNLFRPVVVDEACRSALVVELARNIYEDRAFDQLSDLADALQAAGCIRDDVLDHCRAPEPHVGGCWALDLLLGRT